MPLTGSADTDLPSSGVGGGSAVGVGVVAVSGAGGAAGVVNVSSPPAVSPASEVATTR